ncbi:MAG: biotin/lipoyl-binding protein [Lentisphaerae bacterium]|nr:MAG: biotin/lipoyl-binding protein [Lentisphaerota bacterium]
MGKKRIRVMNTAFRDGFQSCLGARVLTDDFLPAVEAACEAGIDHFEFGGGARFQSLFFYCGESAFDMMDRFRQTAGPDANLQTLGRGINVVGLDSQSSDIIELHAKLFKKHGTTTIRNFDALNDVNNLVYSGQMIKKYGLKHEICITMMALPPGCTGAHDADFYMKILDEILAADVEFDSLCFKDASGTSVPATVYETIKRARQKLGDDVHIRMHTHETAGTSVLTYKAALEAGADGIDLSMAPMSGGTCQPDIVTMWHALRDTDFDLGIDIDKVLKAEAVFKECMEKYDLLPEDRLVEPLIPWSPMPGGALTANTQMLRDNGLIDKYPEIFAKMGECVRRGGFGTSVTPVSQFYFQQAFNNYMFGDWKKIAEGYGKMVLGYFGKTPCPPDPEIVKIAQEQLGLEPTQEDPRAINDRDPSKGVEAAKKMLTDAGITDLSEENIFIAATCKEKGIQYLKGEAKVNVRLKKEKAAEAPAESRSKAEAYDVVVEGKKYHVSFDGDAAVVNGKRYNVNISAATAAASSAGGAAASGKTETIKAALPGLVLRINVAEGDSVKEGDVVLILEAMKMETEVKTPVSGTVTQILVAQSDQVKTGQPLLEIAAE